MGCMIIANALPLFNTSNAFNALKALGKGDTMKTVIAINVFLLMVIVIEYINEVNR